MFSVLFNSMTCIKHDLTLIPVSFYDELILGLLVYLFDLSLVLLNVFPYQVLKNLYPSWRKYPNLLYV